MNTTYFEDFNLLGFELKSIQDVLNARNLGFHIIANGGEEYLDWRYDEGIDNWRDATTDELIEEAQAAFRAVGKLYATIDTPTDYAIAPAKKTTMQTDFYVGQKVYVMHDNKVVETDIKQLVLIDGKDCLIGADMMARDITRTFYDRCTTISSNGPTTDYIRQEIDRVRTPEHSSACVKIDERHMFVELTEVFATKEALAKHLIEEAN